MKILLLSPYDAASHRVWREGLVRHIHEYEWTVLTLPPRFFAWRSRGNPLSLVFGCREVFAEKYDLVVATSMTDLAELKGIAPGLSVLPSIAYFHENQFAYPERKDRKEYQNYKITNLYTALAADRVLFNSRYNMDTFLQGAGDLLSIMPDHVPEGIIQAVQHKSQVIPVPLEKPLPWQGSHPTDGPLTLIWNHRWEHDKAPERFFRAMYELQERDVPFRLHVVGQQFSKKPDIFAQARERLGSRILTWGFVEDRRYRSLLSSSDVVVSTALHDFQGLAVLEGVAAGCRPVVPDRLAYPEFIPGSFRYPSHIDDPRREAQDLSDHLEGLCLDPRSARDVEVPDLEYLSWDRLVPRYREVIEGTVTGDQPGTHV